MLFIVAFSTAASPTKRERDRRAGAVLIMQTVAISPKETDVLIRLVRSVNKATDYFIVVYNIL